MRAALELFRCNATPEMQVKLKDFLALEPYDREGLVFLAMLVVVRDLQRNRNAAVLGAEPPK